MKMCYDGALVMPSNYAVMDEEEMTYVEGGATVSINYSYLNKDICMSVAKNYVSETGMSQLRIAKEIYAHAFAYYSSPFMIPIYAKTLLPFCGLIGFGNVLTTLYIIRSHANPVNLGGDSAVFERIYDALWIAPIG